MDININIDNFANAYNCLYDAYQMVKNGLGDFSQLNKDALLLIDKSDIQNIKMLDMFYEDCQLLEFRMSKTIELLSQINCETANYFQDFFNTFNDSSVSFSSNVFTYVVDLDHILLNYANGINLSFTGGLGNFYKEKNAPYSDGVMYLEDQLRVIWENDDLSIREKIVNGSLKHIALGIDVGKKVNYEFAGTQGDGSADYKVSVHSASTGFDCNAKVSFDIFNVVDSDIGWLSVPDYYNNAGVEISVSEWERAQPADIFVRLDPDGEGAKSQHVGLIVRNNTSDMTFDVVEARGPGYGVVARTISYDDMKSEKFIIKDMGSLYGE